MDKRIHDYERHARLEPEGPLVPRANEEARQRHCQELVRHAENLAQGADQRFLPCPLQIGDRGAFGCLQLTVDPTDKIVLGDVPDEQKEAVGNLVQPPITQT